jgi:regulator of cell morphogenesis and NO signaling
MLSTLQEALKLNASYGPFDMHAPKVFLKFFEELANHIEIEEEKLYPYAFKLENNADIQDLSYSTKTFAVEHKTHQLRIDDLIAFVEKFEKDFASNFAFTRLQKQLNDFKLDIDLHELLEDNVLIPKLAELEKKIGL